MRDGNGIPKTPYSKKAVIVSIHCVRNACLDAGIMLHDSEVACVAQALTKLYGFKICNGTFDLKDQIATIIVDKWVIIFHTYATIERMNVSEMMAYHEIDINDYIFIGNDDIFKGCKSLSIRPLTRDFIIKSIMP